jgi:hypothetical protein
VKRRCSEGWLYIVYGEPQCVESSDVRGQKGFADTLEVGVEHDDQHFAGNPSLIIRGQRGNLIPKETHLTLSPFALGLHLSSQRVQIY